MAESTQIDINGDGNITSGRDMVFQIQIPKALRFCEEDLRSIVVAFAEKSKSFSVLLSDFTRPRIVEKNSLNKLSDCYFDYIKENSLPYFFKIESFLKDPRNVSILRNYQSAVGELQHVILSNRENFDRFEQVFDALYQHMISTNDGIIRNNKILVIVFFHFMYWNCDIGRKK